MCASPLVSIAQIEGHVRAAGSGFMLARDMRFAARASAIFGQFEPSFGVIRGGGGARHLTRLMGRARALEVMLSAEDYDADLAARSAEFSASHRGRDEARPLDPEGKVALAGRLGHLAEG
jgi:enoyl-CoA hydratase/carnithine racemase